MRRTFIFLAALAAIILAGCNVKDLEPVPVAIDVQIDATEIEPYVIKFDFYSKNGVLDAYMWWFGQGANAVQDNHPVHRYTAAGDYHIKVQCRDRRGTDYMAETDITVTGKVAE